MQAESLKKLISEYGRAAKATLEAADKLGRALKRALKKIIPDIDYSVGWEEAGIDTVCLYSEKKSTFLLENRYHLDLLLEDLLELQDSIVSIDCPFGIHVSAEEFRRIGEALGASEEDVERVIREWTGGEHGSR